MPNGLRSRASRRAAQSRAALRELPDADLVMRAREGSADAFEVIYDRHSAVAYSLARRICGPSGAAEEVVQDSFLSLWRGLDRYEPTRGQVRSWVLGIVHNSAVDKVRRSAAHDRRRAQSEGIEERFEAPERTEEEVEQRAEAAEVRQALGTLPEEQRRAIELAYFEGLTHTQISRALGAPVGTVKGRVRLGLLKLHSQLAGLANVASSGEEAAR